MFSAHIRGHSLTSSLVTTMESILKVYIHTYINTLRFECDWILSSSSSFVLLLLFSKQINNSDENEPTASHKCCFLSEFILLCLLFVWALNLFCISLRTHWSSLKQQPQQQKKVEQVDSSTLACLAALNAYTLYFRLIDRSRLVSSSPTLLLF